MIIRDGFVTNSSSTNFMIICKEELTREYLLKKLGFKEDSKILGASLTLVDDILHATKGGLRWFDIETIDYDVILEAFGKESADKYRELSDKGYHTYLGHTNSDDDYITSFMTMDSFIIDQKDFYMDGKNCGW